MQRFEWDDRKALSNYRKHGITFEEATELFFDASMELDQDRIVDGEQRWHALGRMSMGKLILVAHSYREEAGDQVIRIISARKADGKERRKHVRYGIHDL